MKMLNVGQLFGGQKTSWKIDEITENFIDEISSAYNNIFKSYNGVDDCVNAIEQLPAPAKYNDFVDVFNNYKQSMINLIRSDQNCSVVQLLYLPILEAITSYKVVKGHLFICIRTLGHGNFNYGIEINDDDGNVKVLRIRHKLSLLNNRCQKVYDAWKIAFDSNLPNLPIIYFGSHEIEHEYISGRLDFGWAIIKEYSKINTELLINNSYEVEKCFLAMIRIACAAYEHGLAYNDWQVENMLYDEEMNDYVLGDIDFIVYNKRETTSASLFIKLKYIYSAYKEMTPFDLMVYMIKEALVEFMTHTKYGTLGAYEINDKAKQLGLSGKLKMFVDTVRLPTSINEYKPLTVQDLRTIINS